MGHGFRHAMGTCDEKRVPFGPSLLGHSEAAVTGVAPWLGRWGERTDKS